MSTPKKVAEGLLGLMYIFCVGARDLFIEVRPYIPKFIASMVATIAGVLTVGFLICVLG